MESQRIDLARKRERLAALLEQRSRANCDTRHLSPSDLKRETDIEDLEEQVQTLEKKLGASA